MITDQEHLQLNTTVDVQPFGGSISNSRDVSIHGQPLQYRDFSSYILMNSHATMDIDSWIYGLGRRSDLAKSYSGGGQPPSIGDVRQMVVSEVSGGSNQISSDGQPPSVNDVGRREPSQSEASYEGPDEHEVISELNDGAYNRGGVGRSIEITTYSGYDGHTQDLISRFGLNFSQSFGVPHMTFNSIDSTGNYGGVWAPPPKPFQQMRTYTKVYKRGSVGRSIEITTYSCYYELQRDLARRFGIEGQLENRQRIGWKLVYVDHENDVLLVGEDPWEEFVNCVQSIKILSPQEVRQMSSDSDYGGNSVVQNQARITSVMEQFNGRLLNLF